jgi:hypothetical protein
VEFPRLCELLETLGFGKPGVHRYLLIVLGGLSAASAVGCASDQTLHQKLFQPGPAQYQRQRAEKYDPYNEIPIGPRDDSSRPPDFQQPNPEAAQGRWKRWGWPRFGHDPPTEAELLSP